MAAFHNSERTSEGHVPDDRNYKERRRVGWVQRRGCGHSGQKRLHRVSPVSDVPVGQLYWQHARAVHGCG